MASKTETEIITSITDNIQALRSDTDISSGTVLKDVCIDSPSTALGITYDELDTIRHAQSISYVSSMTDAQVEELAANYALTRKSPTASQGYVTLFRRTEPPGTITINAGSTISTQKGATGTIHSFITLTTATITAASYSLSTGLWETTIAIQSVLTGISENVPVNTLTVATGISGIDGCTNRLALTSGTDRETNAQLALRITTAAQAKLLGTAPGYENLVNAITGVESSKVVTPGDTDAFRLSNGNEVDVVVMGDDITSITQTEIFSSADGLSIFLDYTPVDSVSTIQGLCYSFVSGVDFQLVEDTTSENHGSIYSLDKIVWLSGGNKPANSESYTISYAYNKLISDVQTEIDLPANTLIASDVLVREATKVLVDISMSVAITSGTSSTDAIDQIETEIANYFATLTMSDSLEQSDIIYYLRDRLSFIDNITVPFLNIARRGNTGTTDLTATKFEYFAIDDTSLTITVI